MYVKNVFEIYVNRELKKCVQIMSSWHHRYFIYEHSNTISEIPN